MRYLLPALVGIAVLIAVACTSDESPEAAPSPTPTEPAAASPSPSATPGATEATSSPAATPASPSPTPPPTLVEVRVVEPIEVRSGPQPGYRTMRQLAAGEVVGAIASNSGWLQIESGGWIDGRSPGLEVPDAAFMLPLVVPEYPVHDPWPTTGVEALDDIGDALQSGDPATIAGVFGSMTLPCDVARETGHLSLIARCDAEEDPLGPLFVTLACELSYDDADRVADAASRRHAEASPALYAIYRPRAETSSRYVPDVDWVIVLVQPLPDGREFGTGYLVRGGAIIGLDGDCSGALGPGYSIKPSYEEADFLVPPPADP